MIRTHSPATKSSPSTSRTSPTPSSRPTINTSAPRTPSSPSSPHRSDSFETRSPKQETAPKSPSQESNDGWETVSSKKKPSGQRPVDPERRYNQSLQQIHNSLDTSVNKNSAREYHTVKVSKEDIGRIHGDLKAQYHNQPIPGTNGRERFYVTQPDWKKAGGFNITAHQFSKNGQDMTKQGGQKSWLNLHVEHS